MAPTGSAGPVTEARDIFGLESPWLKLCVMSYMLRVIPWRFTSSKHDEGNIHSLSVVVPCGPGRREDALRDERAGHGTAIDKERVAAGMTRDEILTQLRERIVAFAASRMGRDVGEDLAQEVLVVIEQKYNHVTELADLLPLSLQIVRFKMAGSRRKSFRRGESGQISLDDIELRSQGATPEEQARRSESIERITAAVQKLGERCRELFRLKLLGRSFAEIQEHFGAASINTIYTWDARCRKNLLDLIGGKWDA